MSEEHIDIIERLRARDISVSTLEGAADEIASLRAQRERMWCTACGTVTRDNICDCTGKGTETGTQSLVNYADAMQEAAHEQSQLVGKLETQLAIARKAIQDYLDGNYPNPRQYRPEKCPHGQYWYMGCEECDTEHFTKALAALA